jgi:ABC-type amino acid transport substrate-binding protein
MTTVRYAVTLARMTFRIRSMHRRTCFFALLLASLLVPLQAMAQGRLERIAETGALRVCIWPDYYGISFRNPRTGRLAGIDIDNANELARHLGVRTQFVNSSFATLFEDIENDRCDIAMFAIGITPARQARLRFTQPYLLSDIYAITTRTNPRIQRWEDIDRPGIVVAVARGTLHEPIMQEKLQHAELRILDTPHAREYEVQSGRADVFMTDFPYSRRMLDNSDWARLVAPPGQFHTTPYAWAMAPGDDAFHSHVERALQAMKMDGRLMTHAVRHKLEPIVVR